MTVNNSSFDEITQAVRRIYEHAHFNHPSSFSELYYLTCYFDDELGQHIILWDDIQAAFKNVIHVRLDPRRIEAIPGAIVDVVVAGHPSRSGSSSELFIDSLHEGLRDESQTDGQTSRVSSPILSFASPPTSISRRNPICGLVEEAMENYTHIEKTTVASVHRGPQALMSHSIFDSTNDIQNPQESNSKTTHDLGEIIMRAKQGETHFQVILGNMYRDGKEVVQNYEAAMDWYQIAARQGNAEAQRNIGWMYYFEQGVTKDLYQILFWFQKSADQGYPEGQRSLGWLYQRGLGVPQNFSKAMELFTQAAENGNVVANINIGYMYYNGQGVTQDNAMAMQWYRKAADQGNASAQYNVAAMYMDGQGVQMDKALALEWFKKAARQGHIEAEKRCSELEKP
ncbi:hypothetical protein FBU30_011057 [Linnemannia zychae]|nr:hypothetical protein FBU30_011057 [Linnemannia zychae]